MSARSQFRKINRLNLRIHDIKYDPAVHTLNNLLTQIADNLSHRDAPLLIGSLGRAAVIDSDREFKARGEPIVKDKKGRARDIDLFLPSGNALSLPTNPFPVDTTSVTGYDERIVIENGSYWLIDELVGCTIQVDADVFAPQVARLFGELDVFTFSARTHLALLHVLFDNPKKYATARRVMQTHLSAFQFNGNALYEPFAEFHRLRRRSMRNHARRVYRRVMTPAMRFSLQPFVGKLKSYANSLWRSHASADRKSGGTYSGERKEE